MSIPAYLVLGTSLSGRRGICVDVCKNALPESKVAVFISENETTSDDDTLLASLENVSVVKYSTNTEEKIAELANNGTEVVIFVADSSKNLADEIENFKALTELGVIHLARIWAVVDCKMLEMFPKKVEGYINAMSHFADCMLFAQRSGVANSVVKDLTSRLQKECKPHLLIYVDKRNMVKNPIELTIEETRRISMLFDEYDLEDELDIDEENLPEEPFSLERKPDPYLEKLQNGVRKNPIPNVVEFAKQAHQ